VIPTHFHGTVIASRVGSFRQNQCSFNRALGEYHEGKSVDYSLTLCITPDKNIHATVDAETGNRAKFSKLSLYVDVYSCTFISLGTNFHTEVLLTESAEWCKMGGNEKVNQNLSLPFYSS
jgi:hypothetical protein